MPLKSKCLFIVIFLQALILVSSGTIGQSFFYLLADPEPDENGVMISNYHGVQRKVYNPLISANGGLLYYRDLENSVNTEKSKEYFINTANWLVENSINKTDELKSGEEYAVWEYDFPWRFYGWVEPPYYSALAQAESIYVLALAFDLTNDEKYLQTANRAMKAFFVDYNSGGLATVEAHDGSSIFMQILAKPGFVKTYVLNGHTQALIFLWRYYEMTNDINAKVIFNKGVNYLKENLWKYDTGTWSSYDLLENLSTREYHKAEISQLEELYDITGEKIFKVYADKFEKYLKLMPLDEE
jgi:heparosan-N-sulfate-glucuronate 5-epimerase